MSGSVYLITTDSLREFQADYGGAYTWHSRGAFKVSGDAWGVAVSVLKAIATE